MDTQNIFFSLVRRILCGENVEVAVSSEMLPELYALADAHDLAHLIGQALGDLGALGEDAVSQKFRSRALQAVYRYGKQKREFERICAVLEEENIPFIPLKGAVLRERYPEGWMRSSCDIDVLVKPADLEAAAVALETKVGFTRQKTAAYDLAMLSENGVRLELHFDTMEESRAQSMRCVLANIWKEATPAKPGASRYVLSDEMFYFFHVAHMVRHFEAGGCGVKPFMDMWLLNRDGKSNADARKKLLREGGLWSFAQCVEKLSRIWFSGEPWDDTSRLLAQYILCGGVYGSIENFVSINRVKVTGKNRFLLSKVFLPEQKMRELYPIARKSRWLLPIAHVQRWGRHLFSGMDRLRSILRSNAAVTEKQQDAMATLLERLDIPH